VYDGTLRYLEMQKLPNGLQESLLALARAVANNPKSLEKDLIGRNREALRRAAGKSWWSWR
jgi:hypothetical protein